ncbi:UDP-glycosyltransferase 86A1 isoform X2 [Panicum miliaceum]|uniref:UDP-glycosyltransferase 86A1 isoform X2 n=1 Tax=Panicum miliaceum TaxID=4540 RepID=A0A3L6TVS1_PANMI|nr:UDP-glycosyltransferase 86A1 isoform X2 [Panicum miliaceum]
MAPPEAGGGMPHAVVMAATGHFILVTHLALRLAARGFAITFVSTETVHHQTARALGADPDGYDVFAAARASASAASGQQGLDVAYWAEPRKDTITYIPGVPSIEPSELMSYLQETDTTSVVHRIIFKAFDETRRADYVLCNTVEELELSTIAALRRTGKPFYAVGPIFPAGFARSAVATSIWAESDCSRWLGAQPPGSVLYISFGSYAHMTWRELHEIAAGVLASGARFLWVLRPDVVSSDDPDPAAGGLKCTDDMPVNDVNV